MGLDVCQMLGYSQINESIDLITNNSARTLNIQDKYGIKVGKPGNMIILPAENGYDAIRRQVPVYYSIREGRVIAHTTLSETTIDFGEKEVVDFKK